MATVINWLPRYGGIVYILPNSTHLAYSILAACFAETIAMDPSIRFEPTPNVRLYTKEPHHHQKYHQHVHRHDHDAKQAAKGAPRRCLPFNLNITTEERQQRIHKLIDRARLEEPLANVAIYRSVITYEAFVWDSYLDHLYSNFYSLPPEQNSSRTLKGFTTKEALLNPHLTQIKHAVKVVKCIRSKNY